MDVSLAIILSSDKNAVLIAKRPDTAHLGRYWEFAGGKVKKGESFVECALREAAEEVGIDVELLQTWAAITHSYTDQTITLHPFLCKVSSENQDRLINSRFIWVPIENLADYAFPDANALLLDKLQALKPGQFSNNI